MMLLLWSQLQIAQHVQMDAKDMLGIAPCVGAAASFQAASHGQQAIGDALHRRNDNDDARVNLRLADQICGAQHAFRAQ
jgi:hypothetical protein